MKTLLFVALAFWNPSTFAAGRCEVASPTYALSGAQALSPHQMSLNIVRANGSAMSSGININGPIVTQLRLDIIESSGVTSTKKRTSVTVLHSLSYAVELVAVSGQYLQRYMTRSVAGNTGLMDNIKLGEKIILESSELRGKSVRLKLSEIYNCGKTVVAGDSAIAMPSIAQNVLPPQIMAESALQIFITGATALNNWTITTYPGSNVKSNVGIKAAELYIDGALYGVASYGQDLSNQALALGDGSPYHLYNETVGAAFIFQRYNFNSLLPVSHGEARIRVTDLEGNVSEKIINY